LAVAPAFAQAQPQRTDQLEQRVSTLERKVRQLGGEGVLLVLFGAFCALWAQNTGRNAWLWFFLGVIFSFVTVFVLLWKNSADINRRRAEARRR
jgi:hypothetical protein